MPRGIKDETPAPPKLWTPPQLTPHRIPSKTEPEKRESTLPKPPGDVPPVYQGSPSLEDPPDDEFIFPRFIKKKKGRAAAVDGPVHPDD